jgi:uncharacterized tellurite resistance protein B-like protein
MFDTLKRLFSAKQDEPSTDALQLAGAILLIEVASADFELTETERALLKGRLGARPDIPADMLDQLVDEAMQQHDLAVSLHEHVDQINRHYSPTEKRQLLHDMWSMAYADGELHHYEEGVIRRLADLLYVPHKDFIRAKHEVTGQP